MDGVAVMRIDPEIAKAKLEAYRTRQYADTDAIYKRAAEAYEAACEGLPLVDVSQVFDQVELDAKGRPRIAIARADRKEVYVYGSGWDSRRFIFDARAVPNQGPNNDELTLSFPTSIDAKRESGWALVPMVPADVRPEHGQLRDWFILWEVDEWADRRRTAPPPGDPLLLKHVAGSLYVVLAQWDLSPLEQAIMREALRR